MLRRLHSVVLVLGVLVLVAPGSGESRASVPAPPTTAIFYYPWFGTPDRDGEYQHWQQNGHHPADDVASSFYPARGVYSSSDPGVLDAQMEDVAGAGVGELIVSWWGRGTPVDERLPAVIAAARAHGVQVAAHLEPYDGRTPARIGADIDYLRTLGIRDFFVYRAGDFTAADWQPLTARLSGVRLFAQTPYVGFAKAAGFQGFYTYDTLTYGARTYARLCSAAHRQGLLCAPSVGPGYSALRATGDPRVLDRRAGSTYDVMWRAAIRVHADVVTITSYNEWNEGTQIEPARAQPDYESYDGAWGLYGAAAEGAYLDRTAYWTSLFGRQRFSRGAVD